MIKKIIEKLLKRKKQTVYTVTELKKNSTLNKFIKY
jgi:hypothetical protein